MSVGLYGFAKAKPHETEAARAALGGQHLETPERCAEALIAAALIQDKWSHQAAAELARLPIEAIPHPYRVIVQGIVSLYLQERPYGHTGVLEEAFSQGTQYDGLTVELARLYNLPNASCMPDLDAATIREAYVRVQTREKLELAIRLCKDASVDEVRHTLDAIGVLDDLPATRERLFTDLTDWRAKAAEEPPWTFREAIPRGYASILGGRGGDFKTTIARAWLLSILTGRTIIPGFEPTERGPVINLSGEDMANIVLRSLARYAEIHKIPDDEMDDAIRHLHLRDGRTRPFIARTATGDYERTPYYEEILRAAARIKPKLIVVDTLRQHGGTDVESNPGAGGLFIQSMNELAREVDCGLVVIAHTTKVSREDAGAAAESVRGTSALTDESRATWVVSRADGLIRLHSPKVNYAPGGRPPILLAPDGPAVVSAVVEVDAEALFDLVRGWISKTPVNRNAVAQRQGAGAVMLREIRAQIEGVAPADVVAAIDAGIEKGVFEVVEQRKRNGATVEVVKVV